MILTSEAGNLSVAYINDRKETVQCITKQPFSNLSYQGYFGISARNTNLKDTILDMHIKSVKLTNFDPTKYKRNEDILTAAENNQAQSEIILLRNSLGFTDEQFLEQLAGAESSLLFTDELMSDASDILKRYAD